MFRLIAYIWRGVGLIGGALLAGSGSSWVYNSISGAEFDAGSLVVGLIFVVVGLGLFAWRLQFFLREFKHWNLRQLTAERVVAGMFLLGIGLVVIGIRMSLPTMPLLMANPAYFVPFLGLGLICLATLIGLIFAFAPTIASRTRILKAAVVMDRYVLDDRAMVRHFEEISGDERWTQIVKLRTAAGRELTLVAKNGSFEFASPGAQGNATVKGDRLVRFTKAGR
jgi:hypothetical protein